MEHLSESDRDFIVQMAAQCEHRAGRAIDFMNRLDGETSAMYEIAAERASSIAFSIAVRAA